MALHFHDERAGAVSPGGELDLTGAEAHHAASVRRVRVGEEVTVTDGRGAWLAGTCESVSPQRVVVRIASRQDLPPQSPRLVLVQALAKGDRDELAVQAATELGIDEVVPWQAARSVSRWQGPKAEKGRARWASIVREAAKQAHRAWIAEVSPIATTAQVAERAASARVLVLDPSAPAALTSIDVDDARDLVLVVGPEGGIAPDELERLAAAGAERVRLGDTILRTSTAGPAALAVLNAKLGRW
ncbi:ribosomal RNA small subunit methyltransferase E [Microbacterium barkeri]|uniref:Ribosomal RNA small subunit methyltransferase E n=1 Tax=Microbacterium barkeri TaxID=33917 RepID=A0A9W6H0D5_9MICO|nr:16S rRNA (uracil(1498)-N(3))-methyltransferase [Microbacterium barkeri]MDI6942189.1 16S rRNA (uracil(1498)-N(3))-methyltransferase [Microbacterium barkeri]MDR6876063.1 16S rRNA (uracil1498-N3)-methyltransferase [Microbacterium barkeri]GLJ60180.1 ribosomal RNA small subunit methyltransferase E [Microbacterium barkeri]